MIHFKHVTLKASEQNILSDINLSICEHRVGIVGANGSGKSSLIQIIKGLIKPTQGEISVFGVNVHQAKKKWRTKIGYVFQDPDSQIILPIVEDDIAFGLKNLGLKKTEIRDKVDQILTIYGLEDLRKKTSYTLSGGEKQLLAIAGVLALEPELIIFDEPTTLLDLRNKNRIHQIIHEISKPILLVTHDLSLLHHFDRVIVLEKGRIIADDVPQKAMEFYVESMA